MILIKNRQKKIVVDSVALQHDAQKILDLLHYSDFDLGILITTDATIRRYNRDYRHKDKPTDILSFPAHPTLQAGKRIRVRKGEPRDRGDLMISAEYVALRLEQLGPLRRELLRQGYRYQVYALFVCSYIRVIAV